MPDLTPEDNILPADTDDGWRSDRSVWGNRPTEHLAVLSTRMDRIEQELQSIRREAKEGRSELRTEVRDRLDAIIAAKADAYKIAQLEVTVSTLDKDFKAVLVTKANVWVVNLLAILVFGFIGIILTAVAYNILEARPTVAEHSTAADHSGSNPR